MRCAHRADQAGVGRRPGGTQIAAQDRPARGAIEQIKQEAAGRIEAMQQQHKAEVQALLRRFYGPRSERFDPTQLLLFGQTIDTMPVDTKAVEAESGQKLRHPPAAQAAQSRAGPLPAHLERVVVEHDLSESREGGQGPHRLRDQRAVGVQARRAVRAPAPPLQVRPAPADYQTSDTGAQIVIADKPPQPIEKGLAGPGLLAYVITSKLADHLPLVPAGEDLRPPGRAYRQQHDVRVDGGIGRARHAACTG